MLYLLLQKVEGNISIVKIEIWLDSFDLSIDLLFCFEKA